MPEIARLSGHSDWIDLDFVERERTPVPAMKLGIQMHLAGLSLSSTVSALYSLGVERSRKAVHDWVQKADLQPLSGKAPNQVAVDETVIRINDQPFWLYAAADPQTNELLYLRLFSTTTTALTDSFSTNYGRNTMSNPPCSSSMVPNISKQHSADQGSDFRQNVTEIGMPLNVYLEK
jgi:putative transposase